MMNYKPTLEDRVFDFFLEPLLFSFVVINRLKRVKKFIQASEEERKQMIESLNKQS